MSISRRQAEWLVCGVLVVATAIGYSRTVQNGFVSFDDNLYLTDNRHVQEGLTWSNLRWAMTTGTAANWHPLTWGSHLLDWRLFGNWAGGHHLVSAALHALNACLFFLVLVRLAATPFESTSQQVGRGDQWSGPAISRDPKPKRQNKSSVDSDPKSAWSFDPWWPAALAAVLWAVHPLRVESVAWAAERKDVLSTTFWLLTMLAYGRYARGGGRWTDYTMVIVLYALGLTAKPMLVTLPFVLLLIDYWPLGRIGAQSLGLPLAQSVWPLVREKLPLFALTGLSCIVTYQVQHAGSALLSIDVVPLGLRVAMSIQAYFQYVWLMIWPVNLAFFYPLPMREYQAQGASLAPVVASIAMLISVTLFAWRFRGKVPYLLVGWLWYLGTLVPVIGLIKQGDQAFADRYTYVPHMGLCLAIGWGLAELLVRRPALRVPVGIAIACVALVLVTLTFVQVGTWNSDRALAENALRKTRDNFVAHSLMGLALLKEERSDEARKEFAKAVEISPSYYYAANDLAGLELRRGNLDAAERNYRRVTESRPQLAMGYAGLAAVALQRGDTAGAIENMRRAVELEPNDARNQANYGLALLKTNRLDEAVERYQQSLSLNPDQPDLWLRIARIRMDQRQFEQAEHAARQALEIRPQDATALSLAGFAIVSQGRPAAGVDLLRQSLRIDPKLSTAANNLAWILATHPAPSIRNGAEALKLATRANESDVPPSAGTLDTLAAALAECGQFDKAVDVISQAIQHADSNQDQSLRKDLESRRALYQAKQAYRDPSLPAGDG